MSRVARSALAAAGVAAGAEVSIIVARAPGYQPFLPIGWALVAVLLPGCALIVVGYAGAGRAETRSAGLLLSGAGVAWFVAGWNSSEADSRWVFAAGRLASLIWPVLAVHAVLRWQAPLRRVERALLAACYLWTGVLGGLVSVLFVDPTLTGCSACAADPLLIMQLPTLAAGSAWLAAVGGVVWSGLLVVVQIDRLLRCPPLRRRLDLPVALAGVGVCTITWAWYVRELWGGGDNQTALDSWLWLCQAVLLVGVACGAAWPAIALRITRLRLVRLVVEAASAPVLGGLSATLATVLNDPSARLLYPVADGWLVDANGAPASPPASTSTLTRLHRGESTIAYLANDTGSLEAGPLLDEITRTIRLTLDNERLHAQHSWQLRQLQESRRRIVAAADRERRTLERDLHDGAQQGMVALSLALSLAELQSSEPNRIALLQAARREVTEAVVELRAIARGVYPRELGDEGLDAALEVLAESSVSPVTIDLLLGRTSSALESATYFAVRQCIERQIVGAAAPARVRIRRSAVGLTVDICTDQRPEGLLAVEDRVGAVGGSLTVQPGDSPRVRVHLELPCAS